MTTRTITRPFEEQLLPASTPLQRAFIEAGIRPFVDDDVEQYKAERFALERDRIVKPTTSEALQMTGVIVVAVIFAYLIVSSWKAGAPVPWLLYAALLACLPIFGGVTGASRKRAAAQASWLRWDEEEIGFASADATGGQLVLTDRPCSMVDTIPGVGRALMQRLAQTGCPMSFSVVYLGKDPFLRVRYCGQPVERYYFYAWDESYLF